MEFYNGRLIHTLKWKLYLIDVIIDKFMEWTAVLICIMKSGVIDLTRSTMFYDDSWSCCWNLALFFNHRFNHIYLKYTTGYGYGLWCIYIHVNYVPLISLLKGWPKDNLFFIQLLMQAYFNGSHIWITFYKIIIETRII